MQWTPEQSQIINNLRDKNLLVSAAAGSGKTTVLVERIIKIIIEDRVNIDRLLIVTFTRAAAAEMRIKIQEAIEDRLEEGNQDNNYLIEQLNLLYKAKISTIHSFCKDIIKSNFHLIDIDPAFSMIEEGEKNLLIAEAINDVLENAYQDPEIPFQNIVEAFSSNRDDRQIERIILDLYNFSMSQPYPFKWLEEMSELYDLNDIELDEHIWLQTIADKITLELEGIRELLLNAADLSGLPSGPREYLENLEDELQNIEFLLSGLEKGFSVFLESINELSFGRLNSIRAKRKEEVDSSLQDEVKKLRNEAKDSIRKLQKKYTAADLDKYEEQINKLYPMVSYLIQLVKEFSLSFDQLKRERSLMDFNDLEHYAIKILENRGVREFLQNKFRYIFVDEYQDSNMVQETIIKQVSRGNNLFLVGDVKQSIYRFRLAEPSLFIEKYTSFEKFEVNKELKKDSVRIDLSKNFRSRGEILSGINYLFDNLMSRELGEIEYDSSARLYKGLDFEEIDGPELELNIIEKKTDDLDIDQEIEDMGQAEVEARLITEKIKGLIGQKYYNAKKSRYQEITYRDVVILMRSPGTRVETYQEVFSETGIPLFVDDDSGFFDTLEIKIFLNLLRLIDNRRQDIPLLSVLRSPIVNLTADQLADIRIKYPEGSFYDAAFSYIGDNSQNLADKISNDNNCILNNGELNIKNNYIKDDNNQNNNDSEIKEKLITFINRLNAWIEEERYLGIDKFIWKLLQESGFYNYAGAMPGGRQRQANLRILVDRARQFASNSEQSLFNYIRYIERLEEQLDNETGTARLINENEDVVRLMSIHKSKGLEFPVVIVADLGKRFNTNDLKGSLLLHRELGLGPKFVDPEKRIYNFSLPQLAIKERKRRENLSEELRILYVALTRAVDRLILFGTASNLENRSKKWLRGSNKANLINAGSMLDWICSALAAHPGGKTIRELPDGPSQIPSIDENTIESKWHINVYTRESLEIENLEESEDFLERKKSLKEGFAGTTGRKSTQINNEDSKNIDYTRNDQITKDHISKSHITKDYITKDQVRDLKNEIKRRMEWQYPYRAAEGLPSKMSVTEIKDISVDEKDFAESGKVFYEPGQQTGNRDNQVSDVRVNIRKDIVSDSKLPGLPELSDLEQGSGTITAAEKGSIVHFVMQHLNLSFISQIYKYGRADSGNRQEIYYDLSDNDNNPDESSLNHVDKQNDVQERTKQMLRINLKEQIEEMVVKELISEKEADIVDYDKIIGFFNTAIGQRVLAADKVKREAPFVIKKEARRLFPGLEDYDETILVQGIIDCYFIEKRDNEERLVLLDYKTDYVYQGRIEIIKKRYRKQLEIYREALEKILKRPVNESYIYLFDSGDVIAI